MNKPVRIGPKDMDEDVGPLDENGEQLWTAEKAAAIDRLVKDPEFIAGCREAEEDIDNGRVYTTQEVTAWMAERKREWRPRATGEGFMVAQGTRRPAPHLALQR